MDVPVEFIDAVSALPLRDSRPICAWCDRGKLDVIKQWSDSCGGIMGGTLKCDAPKWLAAMRGNANATRCRPSLGVDILVAEGGRGPRPAGTYHQRLEVVLVS